MTSLPSKFHRAVAAFVVDTVLLTSALVLWGCRSFSSGPAAAGTSQTQQSEQKPKPPSKGASAEEPSKSQLKRMALPVGGWDLVAPSDLASQPSGIAAARGIMELQLLAPQLGKMYGAKPLFAWSHEGQAQEFTFVLRDNHRAEVLRQTVTEMQYRPWAVALPQLEPGKIYSWEVEFPGRLEASPTARFKVVSSEERAAIEQALAGAASSDDYQAGLARARVFTEHRLWYDAIGAYTDLIGRYPGRAEPYNERGRIYEQLEITKRLADRDFSRAKEIEKQNGSPNQ